MTAVQRDERRECLRRACSRWRRAAKLSTSSESSSALAGSGSGACSIGGTSDGASVIVAGSAPALAPRPAQARVPAARLDRRRLGLGCGYRFGRLRRQNRRRRLVAGGGAVAAGGGGSSARAECRRLRLGFRDHAVHEGGHVGRALRPAGEPGRLAAGATHRAPGRADGGLVDHVGGGAVRADDQHVIGANLAPKPSSRPLMDWKPWLPGRSGG